METLRIAIATTGLGASLREAIATAAGSGASGVQFDLRSEVAAGQFGETASKQLLHLLTERNLQLASGIFPLRRPLYDPVEIDGRVHVVKEAIRLCGRLKCRVLTLRVGRIPEDADIENRSRLLGALSDLARLGAREGVTPAVSTSGDSAVDLRNLVESIKDGPIGIDLDPAGCISGQQSPAVMLRSLHDVVVHLQGRDAVRDLESGSLEVALGRGETPWDELIATLADMRFPGWMTVRRTSGDRARDEALNGVRYLRSVASGA